MFSVGLLVALPANAQQYQSIIIYSDGSITGTNNIQHDGNTYTLTDNIFGHIQVQKSYVHPLVHKIEENPIPELHLWGLIPLILLVSLLAVYAQRQKPSKV